MRGEGFHVVLVGRRGYADLAGIQDVPRRVWHSTSWEIAKPEWQVRGSFSSLQRTRWRDSRWRG